jgi:hypothetical protein
MRTGRWQVAARDSGTLAWRRGPGEQAHVAQEVQAEP